MRILRLTLKKKWFNMIDSGIKVEEYREIKQYWWQRLCNGKMEDCEGHAEYKEFDYVEFRNGYGKRAPKMLFAFNGIAIGKAKPEWSDNWQGDVFVIKLGGKISHT